MTEADARIRLYEASDDKRVKFSIGMASMEGLAVANRSGMCCDCRPPLFRDELTK